MWVTAGVGLRLPDRFSALKFHANFDGRRSNIRSERKCSPWNVIFGIKVGIADSQPEIRGPAFKL